MTATGLRGRRGLVVAAGGCAFSGAVVMLAAGRVWLHYEVQRPGLAPRPATATGHNLAETAATLALVMFAGVFVLPAARGVGRRLAGAILALAGLGIGYAASATIASKTGRLPGPSGGHYEAGRLTVWPWLTASAGLVALLVGLFVLVASRFWPAMGRRFESGSAPKGNASEASMWDRLDEGEDPTI